MRRSALPLMLLLALAGCDDSDDSSATGSPATPSEATLSDDVPAEPEPTEEPPPEATPREEHASASDPATLRRYRRALAQARRALRRGESTEAVRLYREAVRIERDGRALCELGWVHFQAERMTEAREAMETAIRILPGEPVPERFVAGVGSCLYNLGRLEEAAGRSDKARLLYVRSLRVRPGNPTVAQRLAGLGAAPDEPTEPFACVGGGAGFDVAAWTARVNDSGQRAAALQELGFDAFEESELGFGDEPPTCQVVSTIARFSEGAGHVLDVRCGESDIGANRVAVVLDRPDGRACVAGRVSVDVDSCSTACLGDETRLSISTVPLTAEHVDALRFDTNQGACGCSAERGALAESSFYGVHTGQLVRYLRIETFEAWYSSPTPPMSTTEAEISFGADYPREIVVRRRVLCDEVAEGCEPDARDRRQAAIDDEEDQERRWQLEDELLEECGPEAYDCEPSDRTTRYTFRDGTYEE